MADHCRRVDLARHRDPAGGVPRQQPGGRPRDHRADRLRGGHGGGARAARSASYGHPTALARASARRRLRRPHARRRRGGRLRGRRRGALVPRHLHAAELRTDVPGHRDLVARAPAHHARERARPGAGPSPAAAARAPQGEAGDALVRLSPWEQHLPDDIPPSETNPDFQSTSRATSTQRPTPTTRRSSVWGSTSRRSSDLGGVPARLPLEPRVPRRIARRLDRPHGGTRAAPPTLARKPREADASAIQGYRRWHEHPRHRRHGARPRGRAGRARHPQPARQAQRPEPRPDGGAARHARGASALRTVCERSSSMPPARRSQRATI